MARLEFFFDCSSPWTYLAFHKIEALASAQRAGGIARVEAAQRVVGQQRRVTARRSRRADQRG